MNNEQRERLIKLLGMLGSEHIGERAVAAKKIEELRAEIGMEWAAIVIVIGEPTPTQAAAQFFSEAHGAIVDPKLPLHLLDAFTARLSAWEKEFLQDLERKRCAGGEWSAKQRNKLFEIAKEMSDPTKERKGYRAFGGGGWR